MPKIFGVLLTKSKKSGLWASRQQAAGGGHPQVGVEVCRLVLVLSTHDALLVHLFSSIAGAHENVSWLQHSF